MTEHEIERLAQLISDKSHVRCPMGWDAQTVADLKDMAANWATAKKAGIAAMVTVLVGAFLAALWAGVVQFSRR